MIFLIALTAADAWRRSLQQNDLSINQATSPLRENIIDINRELTEIKVILKKQQTVMQKLERQIKHQEKLPIKQPEKSIDIINPDENKMLDKLVNGIVEKPEEEKEKELKTIPILERPKPEIEEVVVEVEPAKVIENKIETEEIVTKKIAENNKLDELPDISALAATNITLNEIKKKRKLSPPKRVTSLPAHTAVPEVSIPDKNPDLTSKTIGEKPERNSTAATSPSQTMLSGKKRGVRMTISDVLESYENNDNE